MTPVELDINREDYHILDVRGADELMIAAIDGDVINIPLNELEARWQELPTDKPIATLCHHGVRSQKAALFLQAQGLEAESMVGGIEAWSMSVDDSVPRY